MCWAIRSARLTDRPASAADPVSRVGVVDIGSNGIRMILAEVRALKPDLVLTGRKPLGAWGRFRSANLPRRLGKAIAGDVALLSVDVDAQPAAVAADMNARNILSMTGASSAARRGRNSRLSSSM